MLKKAGIVVATAAAGLLAVSPLAFAGDKGHHLGSAILDDTDQANSNEELHQGLVNVSDNNINVPVQVCGVLNNVDVLRILSNTALGVLAPASTGNTAATVCGDNSASAGDSLIQTNQNS